MNHRSCFCILLMICMLNLSFSVNAQIWKPTAATINFKIKHTFGATADGSFNGFVGIINFDVNNLANTTINATIDVKTIRTSIKLRDNAMRSKDYFDVEKYPRISMTSTKIEKTIKQNEYMGYFNLTIKNVTKNIKFPFIFTQTNKKGTFTGNFSINRTDYGIGEKSVLLGNTTTIFIIVNTQQ